jgi:YD repeat-containing protein
MLTKNISISAVLFFLTTTVYATEHFYWKNRDMSFQHHYPSHEAACRAYVLHRNLTPHPFTYSFSRTRRGTDHWYYCYFSRKYTHNGTIVPETYEFVDRYGNSCQPNTSYNEVTGECTLSSQKGPPQEKACPVAGNPINFSIGNKFQTEADYSSTKGTALSFIRNYNSLDGLWRHNFSTYLRFAGVDYVSLVRHDGRESFFNISGATVTPTSSDLGVLTKTGTTGWHYVSADNEQFTFDTAGKLTLWSNTQGKSYQLAYSGSQITVTDSLGNSLTLSEDADHQPLSLTAPGVQITYSYNANNRLTSVNRTAGGQTTQRQYHYEVAGKPDLLTGITDERGIRYATWAYDDQGRAISSEHADGADKVTVAYKSDGTVSVTNELGKVAKYSFQYIKGVNRITAIEGEPSPNCPNSNSTFTYDDRGLLKTKTDNKGNLTTYTYNDRGLEISRTEASGTPQARTITTDWHADFFLPVKVTEPDRITQYSYDAQGRQTSQAVTPR